MVLFSLLRTRDENVEDDAHYYKTTSTQRLIKFGSFRKFQHKPKILAIEITKQLLIFILDFAFITLRDRQQLRYTRAYVIPNIQLKV